MQMLLHWIVQVIVIVIAAYLLPGVSVTFVGALVLAVVFAVINILIKPVLTIITLPINILTLGLFSLVVNALLILLTALIVPGFTVAGFWWALLFGLVLSVINLAFGQGWKL